jgi:prenyltransferase beta subunit
VALHALDSLQVDFSGKKDALLDYIDSLWTNEGGFHGSWEDDELDIEYTYYGLLALGHLAL